MLQEYKDIKSRINKEPKWYDENGVPRYDEFHPSLASDIYAREAMLIKIACQNCGELFKVCLTQDKLEIHKFDSLKDKLDMIHYGDPPRHGDNLGETMNCIDLEILEYWKRDDSGDWVRNEEFEIILGDNN